MGESVSDRLRGVNSKLRVLIDRTRAALGGRTNFTVEDIKAIAQPVTEMNPVVEAAHRLRALQPEVQQELQSYEANLEELQVVLEQMRFTLMARMASLETERSHLETVGMWAAALRQTR